MIYITYIDANFENTLTVKNVWNVSYQNVEERYVEFMNTKTNK